MGVDNEYYDQPTGNNQQFVGDSYFIKDEYDNSYLNEKKNDK